MNLPSGDAFAKVPSSLYREETEIKFWTAYRNFYQKTAYNMWIFLRCKKKSLKQGFLKRRGRAYCVS